MKIYRPLSFGRIPTAGVGPDWPDNIYFTFQFYRFPPVTSQQLKLLTSEKVQQKTGKSLPCILASINKDGTVNSGEDPQPQKIMLFISSLKWRDSSLYVAWCETAENESVSAKWSYSHKIKWLINALWHVYVQMKNIWESLSVVILSTPRSSTIMASNCDAIIHTNEQ